MDVHSFWPSPTYPLLGTVGTMTSVVHPDGEVIGIVTGVEVTALGAKIELEDDMGHQHRVFITRIDDIELDA